MSTGDRAVKRERMLGVLAAHPADRLALTSHGAVSWYLDGARTHVSLAGDPVLAVLIDADGDTVITTGSERARLEAEELPDGIRVREVDWQTPLQSAWAGETGVLAEAAVSAELRAARAQLLPAELERYRGLARETAAVLTDVLGAAQPDHSEYAVTAAVGARLLERGIDPVVLLAAGRSRLGHRHPLPSTAALGDRAMVVVCARRHGLIVNLTRWLRFGEPDGAETDATTRILEVEAAYFAATRPGAGVSAALAAGSAAYGRHGFDPDEWRRHHQGGPAGYNGRDPRAVADLPDLVRSGQAFAWNPSAPGAKVEDTVLIGAGATHPVEVLTVDPRWPTTLVHGLRRPAELRR